MAVNGRWAVLLSGPDGQAMQIEGPMVVAWQELSRSGRAWPTAVVVQGAGFQVTFDTPKGSKVLTQDGTKIAGLDAAGPVELDRPVLSAEELAALLSNC